jgi:hypothetical protein
VREARGHVSRNPLSLEPSYGDSPASCRA